MLLLEGSSIVLSNAFDASSVNDFTGGKITTLYLPSIGERLSLLITSLISSTPKVFRFSESIILISGCSA